VSSTYTTKLKFAVDSKPLFKKNIEKTKIMIFIIFLTSLQLYFCFNSDNNVDRINRALKTQDQA
jgi:hypothetical protein